MMRRPPRSTLCPYTPLFRARADRSGRGRAGRPVARAGGGVPVPQGQRARRRGGGAEGRLRSEEHTSELQSRQYLVCRLLLEKKKNATAGAVGRRGQGQLYHS